MSKNNQADFLFIPILFISLLVVALPSFFYPPISDYWEMFYSFHHLNKYEGSFNWLNILNFDVCEQMSYRPLSHLIYYLLHLVFGARFIFFNIFNFLIYFLNVYLLYRFSSYFCKRRELSALFIGLSAFLFNQFDIVLWSCHIHLLFGFTMFFLVFFSYIRFLKTYKLFYLFLVIVCAIAGMWCYEAFFLWPLSIVIIPLISIFNGGMKRKKIFKLNGVILAIIYFVYFSGYIFTRSLGTYDSPSYKIIDFLSVNNFISAGFLVLFNVLYNNLLVNIVPFIPFPLDVAENIYMAGPIINYIGKGGELFVEITGAIVFGALIGGFFYFWRRKYFEEIKITGFLLFLMLTHLYTVFFLRIRIDTFVYSLTEFRYQYVANAFLILIVLFLTDRFIGFLSGKRKIMIYSLIGIIFIFNVFCLRKVIGIYNDHLSNLKKMLSDIKMGIREGRINEKNKLFIDDNIVDYLPSLCWNIEMGNQYIKEGTYQWMFKKEEINCFSQNLDGAEWIIDKENFNFIRKSAKDEFDKAKKINEGKGKQYMNLGYTYSWQGKYQEAEYMFKKFITINPNYIEAYINLGYVYNWQKKYEKSEEMFKKAVEIGPEDDRGYGALGICYRDQKQYVKSEIMFDEAIRLNPKNVWGYVNLGYLYILQKKYPVAEEIFSRARKINSKNSSVYDGLGVCCHFQGRQREAEEMFKMAIELNPAAFGTYVKLGHFYKQQGDERNAKKMYQKALKIRQDYQ